MAIHGYKPITFAFKDMSIQELDDLKRRFDPEGEEFRLALEENICYLATLALDDRVIAGVDQEVYLIRYGTLEKNKDLNETNQVNIRLVTGDHIETAKFVAQQSGIASADELSLEGSALTGAQFRE